MKKLLISVLTIFASLGMTLSLISCDEKPEDKPVDPTPVDPTPEDPDPVDPDPVQSISISGYQTEFEFGDKFDSSSLVVTLHTEGKADQNITKLATVDSSKYKMNQLGTYSIKVSYGKLSESYDVTVSKRTGIKILLIGNSFAEDATQFANQVALSLGLEAEKVMICAVNFGGCTISQHIAFARGDQETYQFHHYEDGQMVVEHEWTLSRALAYADWDYVSFQQASPLAGLPDECSNVISLVRYVKKIVSEDTVMIWHATWAYEQGCPNSGMEYYDNDEIKMFNAIQYTTEECVIPNSEIDMWIPNTASIQLARALEDGNGNKVFDSLNRDGFHLSLTYGRLTAAMTLVCALTGYSATEITYYPTNMEQAKVDLLKTVVDEAIENPFYRLEIAE